MSKYDRVNTKFNTTRAAIRSYKSGSSNSPDMSKFHYTHNLSNEEQRKITRATTKAQNWNNANEINIAKKNRSRLRSDRINGTINFGVRIIGLVFTLLLLFSIVRLSVNGQVPSFTNLLNLFSTMKPVTVPFISAPSIVLGEWVILDFIRQFLEFFVNIFNVIIFMFNGLLSIVQYCLVFLRYMFLGA